MGANFETEQKKQTATLTMSDRPAELGLLAPSIGTPMLDVRTLHDQVGVYTYDPGFAATGSCDSAITYVDGDKGVLLYRGYPIDQLVDHSDFLEVAYLLLNGELPAPTQKAKFSHDITRHTMVHEQLRSIYQGFRRDAHPMAIMCGVVGALSAFYHDSLDIFDPHQRMISSHRMIAKMPTIAAMAYKYSIGQPFVYPRNDLGFAANFLNMMFSVPCEPYEIKPAAIKAIEALLIIQADHEQNASTSTVRMVGSSRANPYACIAAGIASLWGPIHGGANQEALEMLEAMGTVERIPEFLARAKDKNDPFRLMGFGHRVYKSYDPRAKVMRKICNEVLEQYDRKDDPVLQLAKELEKIALDDEYFVARKLYPNVDFYSGIIMRTLGIPTSMFTVLFAVARTVGWVAHWNEMISDPATRIFRPRQLYTGPLERDFVEETGRPAATPLVG